MEQIPKKYGAWVLTSRPKKEILGPKHFEWKELEIPEKLKEEEVLIKIECISFDAYQQAIAEGILTFIPDQLGKPFFAGSIGKIVKSNSEKHKVGERLQFSGVVGEYCLTNSATLAHSSPVPSSVDSGDYMAVGCLTSGVTALYGINYAGKDKLKEGNVFVCSAASGGVGQMAIQFAKLKGMKVIGITGGKEKCQNLVKNFGIDAAVDYKSKNFAQELKDATNGKIDLYFDNTGGEITDTVLDNLNNGAVVALCGLITSYIEHQPQIFKNFMKIITTGSKIIGFGVGMQDQQLAVDAAIEIGKLLQEGKLKFSKHAVSLKEAPKAFDLIFSGEKNGKVLIQL